MSTKKNTPSVRVLPEDVANKIAAGEVVERPASVVKELVENALDAEATRISVRVVAAGRRLIEVIDDGHGMSEQDALLAIERHATSKIRGADDLDNITTLGFRGEALASIASVSRFELVTRREKDDSATHIQIDGGVLRDVSQTGAAVGTRMTVNRLYFNTPVRAKFLKGITTELSHCIDVVQRHALANPGVGFQFFHNDKLLLDIPERADLRERVALIWGLNFVRDMVELKGEHGGFTLTGIIGTPALTRSSRSHQFFFLNGRPVMNRSLQFGFEDGYQGLLTIGRRPVGVVMVSTHPRFVDVNIHPTKREIRFRDERAARDALRDTVRMTMEALPRPSYDPHEPPIEQPLMHRPVAPIGAPAEERAFDVGRAEDALASEPTVAQVAVAGEETGGDLQTEFTVPGEAGSVAPLAVYTPVDGVASEALQLFDTYLLIPEDDRLLIIDQHALHERLNFDTLKNELEDNDYAAQQLAVPVLVDVPPAQAKLLETNSELLAQIGIEVEPFGPGVFQVTAICHLYDEAEIGDVIYRILDELGQGNLFDRDAFMSDLLRLATEACRASVKAGDRLSPEEKSELIDGFRRMRPPYTCPHGRPIITELTVLQMEKSFRRRQ